MDKALSVLSLPNAVEVQTLKLLHQIALAHTADNLFRASNRPEGFVLGLETDKVLYTPSIEGLLKPPMRRPRRGAWSTHNDRRIHSRRGVVRAGRTTRGVRMLGGQDQGRPRLWFGRFAWAAAAHAGCRFARDMSGCSHGPA